MSDKPKLTVLLQRTVETMRQLDKDGELESVSLLTPQEAMLRGYTLSFAVRKDIDKP